MTILILLVMLRLAYTLYAIILCDNKIWQWYLKSITIYNTDFNKTTKMYKNYHAKSGMLWDVFICSYDLTKWRLKDFCLDETIRKEVFGD